MIRKLAEYIYKLDRAIRSLLFCVRCLPFKQAIKRPIWIDKNVKIGDIGINRILLDTPIHSGIIRFSSSISEGLFPTQSSYISVKEGSKLIFKGKASFGKGTRIRIDRNAQIIIGNNFYCNANCFLRVTNEVLLGNDLLLGWEVVINDTDGHPTMHDNIQNTMSSPIKIGNHVWIASYCKINKGACIADGSVVAQMSLVQKNFSYPNSLIGGIPAKLIRENYSWKLK